MINLTLIKAIQKAQPQFLFSYLAQAPLEGLVLEFGVHVGSTIRVIASNTSKIVYGFDSFQGLPEFWSGAGGLPAGTFACDPPKNLPANVELVIGWFEDTLPDFVEYHKDEKISVMHIDCDVYSGARTVLSLTKHMIQHGTIIIFDEIMGYPDWENGEFKAFCQFLEETGYGWECIGIHGGNPANVFNGGEVKVAFRILTKLDI